MMPICGICWVNRLLSMFATRTVASSRAAPAPMSSALSRASACPWCGCAYGSGTWTSPIASPCSRCSQAATSPARATMAARSRLGTVCPESATWIFNWLKTSGSPIAASDAVDR
jgi:hypothetical protein